MIGQYGATDMATAAADGFRDGQRAAHPQASAAQSAPAGEREAFERETRYIVIKRSDLAKLDQAGLLRPESLDGLVDICGRLPPREYVVVESDWPEFQPTWAAIEARVSGLATTVPAGCKVVPVEATEDMEEAGCQAYMNADAAAWIMHRSSMGAAYKAMVAAANGGKLIPPELLMRVCAQPFDIEECMTIDRASALEELRALLASTEGVKDE